MRNVAVPALDDELARRELQFLNCRSDAPILRTLNRLVRAYIHKLPWQSVFRIIKRHVYVLIDGPVGPSDFPRVISNDYGPDGQFLEHVIIIKMIDGRSWRCNAREDRYRIEGFWMDGRRQVGLPSRVISPETRINTMAFSPAGNLFASGS